MGMVRTVPSPVKQMVVGLLALHVILFSQDILFTSPVGPL